jgi:hypothetical protein
MTRRAAAGFGRLLPLLLIAAAALIVTGAALLAACGDSSGGASGGSSPEPIATPSPASPSQAPTGGASESPSSLSSTTSLHLYFLRGEQLGVAERRVPHTTMPATAAMKNLLAGPTADERAAGLSSAIPAGTSLLGLSIEGTTASVDLSGSFSSGGGSLSMTARVAEVVYTLTRFPSVRSVAFFVEGDPVETLGGEGLVLDGAQRRTAWRSFEPAIFVESPGAGAAISSPFLLAGTAGVFEGSFVARLVDSSGRRIVSSVVQASRGAPGRGTFARRIPFSTSSGRGTLIVYSQSMEDGSRQNEVRIPLTFAAD